MTTTALFWKTIEDIPGLATDTRDWRHRLGETWNHARPYLAETPRFAEQVNCPMPGGEHCPRRVVKQNDGSIRAVCGDRERLCKSLELQPKHIRIRELDTDKLRSDIANAFGINPVARQQGGMIEHLGDYLVRAGVGFPVFFSLAGRGNPIRTSDIFGLDRRGLPFVLMVPAIRNVEPSVVEAVHGMAGRVLAFDECVQFARNPRTGFDTTISPSEIFAPEIAILANDEDEPVQPVLALPVGATWGKLKFAFISEEVINISYGKQAPVRIEPDLLGMKNQRNGKATRQWRLLLVCAVLDGALPRSFPVQTIRGRPLSAGTIKALDEVKRGYDRQRQHLFATLKSRFGITDLPPFKRTEDCYEAEFLVDASGLRQGVADQRDRNFADDD